MGDPIRRNKIMPDILAASGETNLIEEILNEQEQLRMQHDSEGENLQDLDTFLIENQLKQQATEEESHHSV